MVKRKTALKIRKAHRYLGIFLGIQFLMWTISGMYFSWTDIDEIHGDNFRKENLSQRVFSNLIDINKISGEISSIKIIDIAGEPFFWVNASKLFNG